MSNKIYFDHKPYELFGEMGPKGAARLWFVLSSAGNPAVLAYPNTPDDTNPKPIRIKFNPRQWERFLTTAEAAFKSGAVRRNEHKKGRRNDLSTDGEVVAGVDENGSCYLAALQQGRGQRKILIADGMYTVCKDGEGNVLTGKEAAQESAISYIEGLRRDMADAKLMWKMENPRYEERKTGGGNGNGWNGNGNGNNGGGSGGGWNGNGNGGSGGGGGNEYPNVDKELPF